MKPSNLCSARFLSLLLTAGLIGVFGTLECGAQELEPRRFSHLPIGGNFGGAGYAYTTGEIGFDPVLEIENAEVDIHTGVIRYIHAFELFEKSARIDLVQGFQDAQWDGLRGGVPASAGRQGWTDTVLRFAVNLYGAPPLQGKEFAEYRKSVAESETIIGAGLAVHLPTGNYLKDKLLNIGSNRFTFRPQLGVVHNRGKWSFELTGAAWFFTDNDEFFDGNLREQDPLFTTQAHVVYTFRPGLWIAGGVGYGLGGRSTINGERKDDRRGNLGWGASIGYPITPKFGVKVGYIGMRTQKDIGANLDTISAGFSLMW